MSRQIELPDGFFPPPPSKPGGKEKGQKHSDSDQQRPCRKT